MAANGPYATVNPIRPRLNLMAYVPLVAAVLVIPFFLVLMFLDLFITGKITDNPVTTHWFDLVCMSPSILGLVAGGMVIVSRQPLRSMDHIFLYLGCVACAGLLFPFAYDFLNPLWH